MPERKYYGWIAHDPLDRLRGWVREGVSDEEIARRMDIHPRTLADWKRSVPEIAAAMERGLNATEARVEEALLKCALGFSYTESIEEDTPSGVKVKRSEKYVPPDVHAILFYLRNRMPERWSDKPGSKSDSGMFSQIIEAVKGCE